MRLLPLSLPLLGLSLIACSSGKGDDTGSVAAGTVAVTTSSGQGGSGGAGGNGAGGKGGGTATCEDGQKNGTETDVDCGGDVCTACQPGEACVEGTDCLTEECVDGVCGSASCTNGVTDGGESDIDCGGPCDPCALGQACVDGDDCATGSCVNDLCAAPSCTDGVKNGNETGLDCGAAACNLKCPGGEGCIDEGDCESSICLDTGLCADSRCDDGIKNGTETDLDCGGMCPDCRAGQACVGNGDCVSNSCSAAKQCNCPVNMVIVPVLGGGAYCIDQAEVTYEQYDAFKDANPQYDIRECEFNTSVDNNYTPDDLWPPDGANADAENFKWKPVRYVDWCDALSYCRWAGKRLCGSIEGGSVALTEVNDASKSQWNNACSNQATNVYPYSDLFNTLECNEADSGSIGVPVNVRNSQGYINSCEGGVPGLYHMSGNLAEWEDSCSAAVDGADQCAVRGGSYATSDQTVLSCDGPVNRDGNGMVISANPVTLRRDTRSADIGFRCCQ